jgi:hypothetical protein
MATIASSALDSGGSNQRVRYIATPKSDFPKIIRPIDRGLPARRHVERIASFQKDPVPSAPRPDMHRCLEEGTYHEHSSGLFRDFPFREMHFGAVMFDFQQTRNPTYLQKTPLLHGFNGRSERI